MEISTEQVSDSYLKLNSCGIQRLWDRDYLRIREHGRVDYHIIYILQGKCTAEIEGNETILECGDMILFMPGEKQKYAFHAEDRPISAYLHFTGTGCKKLMSDIGFSDTHVLRLKKSHERELLARSDAENSNHLKSVLLIVEPFALFLF